MVVVGSHLWHGISSARSSRSALDQPGVDAAFILPAGKVVAVLIAGGVHRHRPLGPLLAGRSAS